MTEQDEKLDRAIARIESLDGTVIGGTGFWVAPGYVMTCAHVVNDALGLDPDSIPNPEQSISVVFPLSRKDASAFKAEIVFWYPVDRKNDKQDIAILKLCRSAPEDVAPLKFGDSLSQRVVIKGFPEESDDGAIAEADCAGNLGRGLIQLNGDPSNPIPIKEGFSGAPAWDRTAQVAVGMIVIANPSARFSQMIGLSVFRSILRQLEYLPIVQALEENNSVPLQSSIGRAYQYVIPQGWEETTVPEEMIDLFNILDDIPVAQNGWTAIAKFLAYLCSDSSVDSMLVKLLNDWGRQEFPSFLEMVVQISHEHNKSMIPDKSNSQMNLSSHLLVSIEPDYQANVYSSTTWIVNNYDPNSNAVPLMEQIHALHSVFSVKLGSIPQHIKESIGKAATLKQGSLLNLKIEVFLPLDLMNQVVESWELEDSNDFGMPMGVEYRVVLRDSGRLDMLYPKCDEWKAMWHRLQQNQEQIADVVMVSGVGDPKKLFRRLNNNNILGLKIAEPPLPFEKNHVFSALARSARPIAIWLREMSSDVDCEALLSDFLKDNQAWDLPTAVKELRNEASDCDDFHIGSHVALMWENPYLVLPIGRPMNSDSL